MCPSSAQDVPAATPRLHVWIADRRKVHVRSHPRAKTEFGFLFSPDKLSNFQRRSQNWLRDPYVSMHAQARPPVTLRADSGLGYFALAYNSPNGGIAKYERCTSKCDQYRQPIMELDR
jgi:hypothetical protein